MMPGVALRTYHALTCKHIGADSLYNEKLFYVDFLLDETPSLRMDLLLD
jgi:hypothetical protein